MNSLRRVEKHDAPERVKEMAGQTLGATLPRLDRGLRVRRVGIMWNDDEAAIRRAVAREGRNLHRLVFGAEPGRGELEAIRPAGTVQGRLAALLSSAAFANTVATPALDGLLAGETQGPLEDALLRFVQRRLGVVAAPSATRLEVLARVIETPSMAWRLGRLGLAWSPQALAAALRDERFDFACSAVTTAGAQAIAVGVEILKAWSKGVRLRLGAAAAGGDYVRLDVGLIGGQSRQGRLFVDYGDGRPSEVDLFPRGRVSYAAVLAAPARIREIHWEFGGVETPVQLRMLTARARSEAEIAHALRQAAGEWALDWLAGERLPPLFPAEPEPTAARLSRQLARRLGGHMREGRRSYVDWLSEWEPTPERALSAWRQQAAELADGVVFGVLIAFGAGEVDRVLQTVAGMMGQVYARWSLRLSPAADVKAHDLQRLFAAASDDARLGVAEIAPPDASLAERLNAMLQACEADWILALQAGDVLGPQTLLRFAEAATSSGVRLIYADHDRLDEHGARCAPAFKPDWSPETLLARDYIGRPAAIRREALVRAGGWRSRFVGAEHYDLLLRLADDWTNDEVTHLPEVLGHLRFGRADAAAETDAARNALDRRGMPAAVEALEGVGRRLRLKLPKPAPRVSLILPTRDRADLLIRSVGSILDLTDYPAFDLTIVDNGSTEPDTLALLRRWAQDPRVRVLRDEGVFNFSRLNNAAAKLCEGEILGLVNNDVEVVSPDWIAELAAWAVRAEIGCVGAKLLFPDDRVQHGGVVLGIGGTAAHAHKYARHDEIGYDGRLQLVHNVSAVTAACLFVRRSVYFACKGLNETLPVNYNDVDFCLKTAAAGHRNLMVPHVALYHHESASRGQGDTRLGASQMEDDAAVLASIWGDRLLRDPYYSPNLTLIHENFDFRWR